MYTIVKSILIIITNRRKNHIRFLAVHMIVVYGF
jgi:hypothetical protein